MKWQSLAGSQVTGRVRSLVRVLQVCEEQGILVYVLEARGLKMDVKFGSFLQRSQESSLPVSRTIVMFCGGVPMVREAVRVTLWWNKSLPVVFEELLEKSLRVEIWWLFWILRGNIIGDWFEEKHCLDRKKMKEINSWTRSRRKTMMFCLINSVYLGLGLQSLSMAYNCKLERSMN